MSLLPQSHTQFQLKSYWDQFFSKRSTPFEWYGQYTDLCHVLHKYIKSTTKTLIVGCGNSTLGEDMYDAGINDITNIDISEVVIKKMGARNIEKRPKMVFTQMDMLAMSFDDATFDCVLDKGTLDAIFSNTDDATKAKVSHMWGEVGRVLKIGGRYICITLAQQHILASLLDSFSSGWLLRAHKVQLGDGGADDGGLGGSLPVIIFIMTKMLTLPGKPPMNVLEVVSEAGRCVRCEDVEGVRQFVNAAQQHAMLLHHLKSLHPGERGVEVQYWSEDVASVPRYTFTIIDIPKSKARSGPFAIFIVPQGREGEWIFSSESGLRGLAEQSSYQRLVVVTLHLGHRYSGLQQVKQEVSGSALAMLQAGLPSNLKLPILSTGEGVGRRVCLCEGVSSVSGPWRVEECGGGSGEEEEDQGERTRRLVFVKTSHLVQTEMRLRPSKSHHKKRKKGKTKKPSSPALLIPDPSHLMFGHHRAMLGALCLSSDLVRVSKQARDVQGKILIIGLGGGALPSFIHRYLPQVILDVCELDPELVEVAEKWFGLERNGTGRGGGGTLRIHIEDGVSFVKGRATRLEEAHKRALLFSAIILDVDSKDLSVGMSSPPVAFLEPSFLTATRSLLTENGVLVTNVAARNEEMKLEAIHSLRQAFSSLTCLPLQEDINDIVVGMKNCPSNNEESTSELHIQSTNGARKGSSEILETGRQEPVDAGMITAKESTSLRDDSKEEAVPSDLKSRVFHDWMSCGAGDRECVRERVQELVRVIAENGADVEGLESELTGLIMYQTK